MGFIVTYIRMVENEVPDSIEMKSIGKLSRSLERCRGGYAFLVGAGTSRAAGIQTSSELIEKWSDQEYRRVNPDKDKGVWINEQEDKIPDFQNRYGFWFEETYTTREERRQFIEELVSDADPTFEHIVLSSLMSQDYVPITLTPNFDDLIYDAFYLYLEERPFLVDHNAIAPQFKITHDESMLVKLHGDYLYDNLKNTVSETTELEENIENVLKTTLNEYGLIVLGYSGQDDSIMNILNNGIDIPDFGLYWCTVDKESISPQVKELLDRDNTFLIEVDSSMDFFYKLYEDIDDLSVPTPVDVSKKATERASQLEDDIIQVGGVEVLGLASEYARRNENGRALDLLERTIDENGGDYRIYHRKGRIHDNRGEYTKAIEDFTKSLEILEDTSEGEINNSGDRTKYTEKSSIINSRALSYSRSNQFEKAISDFERVLDRRDEDKAVVTQSNIAEALICSGNPSKGISKAKESHEGAGRLKNKASSIMLVLIGKIIEGDEYREEEELFEEYCEKGFHGGWNFVELRNFLDEEELENEKEKKIEYIIERYKNSQNHQKRIINRTIVERR